MAIGPYPPFRVAALLLLTLMVAPGCQFLRGPVSTPAEVANRAALLSCGTEERGQRDPANAGARECLVTAFEQHQAAEFISTRPTVEGDPITTIYRVWPTDDISPVVVYTDATQDQFGSGRWHRQYCAVIQRSDTDAVFELDECSDSEVF